MAVAPILKVPPVGLPVVVIVCTALQHALANRSTETEIPMITAVAGIAKFQPVVSCVAPVVTGLIALVAKTLLLVKTFVAPVQPVAAVAVAGPLVAFGPVIVTVPPTSTPVFAPVIAPPLSRQRLPFVATFVTKI